VAVVAREVGWGGGHCGGMVLLLLLYLLELLLLLLLLLEGGGRAVRELLVVCWRPAGVRPHVGHRGKAG
jgi:hypothetical protein